KGEYAEDGVGKLAMNFWPSLAEHVEGAAPESLLEVGLTTGLIEKLGESYPQLNLYGLDRSESSIEKSSTSASAKGLRGVRWICGDFFDVDSWSGSVDAESPGTIYSLHFHELMARGEASFVEALRSLKAALPKWSLLAFEQPLLDPAERAETPETLWLYSQSNVLIHHLIGNGRIQSRDAWLDLGTQAGCRRVTDRPCNYLGYRAFLFEL
ncbi:MAG: class I SAM-dependent methyltransferase, partial [Acidobacteria bacterium]|nr:class I SAM-dependent methyltransferase [Acidobacteriota bacterium]